MAIKVVNKHKHTLGVGDSVINIMRPAILGNPYSHMEGTAAPFKTETRDGAVAAHKAYLQKKILDKDPELCGELNDIFLVCVYDYNQMRHTYLECCCDPLPCHGHFIAELLWEWVKKYNKSTHSCIYRKDTETRTFMFVDGFVAACHPAEPKWLRKKKTEVRDHFIRLGYKEQRVNLEF